MSITILILIAVIAVALAFEFINGFHDCANAIATVVSTKVLSPKQAVEQMCYGKILSFSAWAKLYKKDIVLQNLFHRIGLSCAGCLNNG